MTYLKKLRKTELPRERLEKYGVEKLSNHELIAMLLGSGVKGANVLAVARKIDTLITQKGISFIQKEDLVKIRGLGPAKVAQIQAMLALADRLTATGKVEVLTPKDIWNMCTDFRDSKKEHIVAFYFNTQCQLIKRLILTIGTLDSSILHPRDVFEPALALSAASIILVHNHPTGDLTPSPEDRELTTNLVEAAALLSIPLTDHLIVSAKAWQSVM